MTVAQWDVYPNPSPRLAGEIPFLVSVQSELLDGLATRLVVPLCRETASLRGLPQRLAPSFEIAGERLSLLPQEAGPIEARLLRRPVVSLRDQSHRIVDALDAVISGL